MGKSRGPYDPEYPEGTRVKVASRVVLENFFRTWKYHNKLDPTQLDFSGTVAEVETVGFYHGGDELYKLKGLPGIWHEVCLESE
jgi:hypothetical protein